MKIKIIFLPEIKHTCYLIYSIGPKIGTSVAPPSRKSTDHSLITTHLIFSNFCLVLLTKILNQKYNSQN